MIRTTIFGGSFNPIHKGHINLAQQLLNEGVTDEVWLMVSPHNPLKKQEGLIDENMRLHLAQLAIKDNQNIKASDFEFNLPRPSYTWNTLNKLKQKYPERIFSLLIGADNWELFPKWANYNQILQQYELFVYPRNGFAININSLPSNVHYIDAPLYPFSSTDIRNALSKGENCEQMITSEVAQEIIRLNLYPNNSKE